MRDGIAYLPKLSEQHRLKKLQPRVARALCSERLDGVSCRHKRVGFQLRVDVLLRSQVREVLQKLLRGLLHPERVAGPKLRVERGLEFGEIFLRVFGHPDSDPRVVYSGFLRLDGGNERHPPRKRRRIK